MPHSESIRQDIKRFSETYGSYISSASVACIKRFLDNYENLSDHEWTKLHNVQASLTLLASFRSELNYQCCDIQSVSSRLTERAFVHLRRSIVVDATVRERWKKAFVAGERRCEKLGATHLLSHGIWAFKASAEGERTDLVLGEPLTDLAQVQSTAEALVLTEWGDLAMVAC